MVYSSIENISYLYVEFLNVYYNFINAKYAKKISYFVDDTKKYLNRFAIKRLIKRG